MRVKLKAAHLLRRLEQIDRDLEELERIKNGIKDDRNYAERIRASLAEETVRLRELQGRILGQVIKSPPEFLLHPAGNGAESYVDEPEVVLPGSGPTRNSRADNRTELSEEKSAKPKKPPAGKDKPPGSSKPGSFQFRYN